MYLKPSTKKKIPEQRNVAAVAKLFTHKAKFSTSWKC